MEELIQNMIAQGVIQNSSSPWASPVVLVEKRDGSYRFCVDYRCLNAVTKMDVFPLSRVDDTLGYAIADSVLFHVRFGSWILASANG